MLVVGCMMLPCFFVWEIKYAEYPIASLKFFKNKKCVDLSILNSPASDR